MNVVFHPSAELEASNATSHYTNISKKLGKLFRLELEHAVSRVVQTPYAWHKIKGGFRRCILNRFPFAIIYRVHTSKNECQIFAVMHFKREPGYWQSRTN